ncbi:hypothetical protein Q9R20_04810 [Microbacterium sp. PRF11]|jgi:hypothetical protein|uniref:hypothetical protein n=1 Tax=Microbacterium sp. PRF11 TaxID=2962593 RepID=UPI00288134B3|nr:hypothetical protein [Microbacterium sp. PRF11]MDT0116305.1 hypothetical protein [Microbacterium sp. PRF11]
MAYLIALGILSLAGIVSTLWLLRTDGYRRVPTDARRLPPRAAEPATSASASAPAPAPEQASAQRRPSATSSVRAVRTTHRAA